MGKYIIPLLIIFVACLILGYCTTGDLVHPIPYTALPTSDPNESIFQINLIMVDVNDLTEDASEVLSVWGIFVNIDKKNSMEIAFKPLYPVPGAAETNGKIDNLFSLDSQNGLSAQFLKYIGDTYNFPWDNYIVLDHRAVTILSDYITSMPADIQTDKPTTTEGEQALVDEQKTLLQDICQSLTEENLAGKPLLNWRKIMPAHFLTDLSERTVLDNWALIIQAKKPTKCKILANQQQSLIK
jgi:hypothetical protein